VVRTAIGIVIVVMKIGHRGGGSNRFMVMVKRDFRDLRGLRFVVTVIRRGGGVHFLLAAAG
jgi:hypothetical protein